jgi:hypothetical protein
MQEDGGRIKAAGKMSYELFLNWIEKKLAEGSDGASPYPSRGP